MGNSFVEWRSDTGMLAIRSDFETPVDVDAPLDPREAVFDDALPVELRGYRVRLSRGDRRDTFEFERAFPHRLARWDRSDGGSLKLQTSIRSRYWEKTSPGDEHILAPPGTR